MPYIKKRLHLPLMKEQGLEARDKVKAIVAVSKKGFARKIFG